MSANLLTLNSPKTEFLFIGLKQQLSKIDSSSLDITHSAHNLGFVFDEHLTFSDQISTLSKSCYSHIRALRCIRPYLDSHRRALLSFILNSTTATLCIITFPALNYTGSNRFKILLLVLLSRLLNLLMPPQFSNLSTGCK